MGGRGASSGNSKNPHEKFIQSLIGEDMPRGDLQGVVEAYAMSNGLSPRQEDELLNEIDRRNSRLTAKNSLNLTSEQYNKLSETYARVGYKVEELQKNNKYINKSVDEIRTAGREVREKIRNEYDYVEPNKRNAKLYKKYKLEQYKIDFALSLKFLK